MKERKKQTSDSSYLETYESVDAFIDSLIERIENNTNVLGGVLVSLGLVELKEKIKNVKSAKEIELFYREVNVKEEEERINAIYDNISKERKELEDLKKTLKEEELKQKEVEFESYKSPYYEHTEYEFYSHRATSEITTYEDRIAKNTVQTFDVVTQTEKDQEKAELLETKDTEKDQEKAKLLETIASLKEKLEENLNTQFVLETTRSNYSEMASARPNYTLHMASARPNYLGTVQHSVTEDLTERSPHPKPPVPELNLERLYELSYSRERTEPHPTARDNNSFDLLDNGRRETDRTNVLNTSFMEYHVEEAEKNQNVLIDDMMAKINKLEAEKDNLEKELQVFSERWKSLDKRFDDKVKEINSLKQELTKPEAQLDDLHAKVTKLNSQQQDSDILTAIRNNPAGRIFINDLGLGFRLSKP